MNNIFIGFIFVFLDFNLDLGSSRIGLIPDFIGYVLIYQGLKELSGQSRRFSNAALIRSPSAMAVYTAACCTALDLLRQYRTSLPQLTYRSLSGSLSTVAVAVYFLVHSKRRARPRSRT